MFQLTIQTGNQAWPFLFKDKAKAEEAHKATLSLESMSLHGNHRLVKVSDDFGRIGEFYEICGVVFEDLDQSMFANIALAIHQQHTQIKFNTAAATDPLIRTQRTAGPSVITPMGMNGRGMS